LKDCITNELLLIIRKIMCNIVPEELIILNIKASTKVFSNYEFILTILYEYWWCNSWRTNNL